MALVKSFEGVAPTIDATAFLADNATVIGDVVLGARSSIWFGTVVRGDVNYIRIGDETSVQDNSMIHVTRRTHPTLVGSRVTIGHCVTLHGCTISDRCLIGMSSTILDGAVVGERCIVGAGALVTPNTHLPSGTLSVGSPARVKRDLTEAELAWIETSADNYVELYRRYLRTDGGAPPGPAPQPIR
jgi:carbonic anhydrase/acetyltransferase-like protein (isoleucine patch superfamily)